MSEVISIIIPVYKAEAFLRKCLDSILSQTYRNLEIILVNDGSPDACPQICDQYAEKDTRIVVVHKENGGASSARNAGLEVMTGRYLCFVDSDDCVAERGIELLYRAVRDNQAQYAAGVCGIMHSDRVKNPSSQDTVIDMYAEPSELLEYLVQRGSYSPYAKLFDAEIIGEHHIRYDETLKCSEDALFIRQYLKYCSKVALCSQVVYLYNTGNPASLSKRGYAEYAAYFHKKLVALQELVDVLPLSEKEKELFLATRALAGLQNSIYHYTSAAFAEKRYVLIERAIRLLRPWFAACEPACIGDEAIKAWFVRYRTALFGEQVMPIARRWGREGRISFVCTQIRAKVIRVLRS